MDLRDLILILQFDETFFFFFFRSAKNVVRVSLTEPQQENLRNPSFVYLFHRKTNCSKRRQEQQAKFKVMHMV